jgi:hypothetical protein
MNVEHALDASDSRQKSIFKGEETTKDSSWTIKHVTKDISSDFGLFQVPKQHICGKKENKIHKARNDVIVKKILTGLKIYYSKLCLDKPKRIAKKDTKRIIACFNKIDEVWNSKFKNHFCESEMNMGLSQILHEKLQVEELINNEVATLEDVKLMICSMIMKKATYKYCKFRKFKQLHYIFYNALEKYSIRKLNKLMATKWFMVILKSFVESKDFELVLKNQVTSKYSLEDFELTAKALITPSNWLN